MHLTRTGRVVRLIDDNGRGGAATPDQSAAAILIKARAWWAVVAKGEVNAKTLADLEGVTASWLIRIVWPAFLAPEVVETILNGTLRGDMAAAALIQTGAIPDRWDEQRFLYLPRT